ncbi:Uncharacterized protein APZ42_004112 [Daphnia magna]|uniref:Uncharacterized protein n=1 Tax=Daphnia magna TaxID=35525 RepID=A0A164H922_9CRUS|nr:Uncharacterized protein APZ42_004112 [Daphnia magna]
MLMVISRIQTHPGPHPDPDQTSTRTEHPERRRLNGTSQPPDTGHRQPPDERTNQDHGEFKVDTKDGIVERKGLNWQKSPILTCFFVCFVIYFLYDLTIFLVDKFVPSAV